MIEQDWGVKSAVQVMKEILQDSGGEDLKSLVLQQYLINLQLLDRLSEMDEKLNAALSMGRSATLRADL